MNYKYQIAYNIIGTILFSLIQLMLPVAAQNQKSKDIGKIEMKNSGEKCQFTGHFSSIESIDISPDGKSFITASGDNHIKLWDISTGKLIHTFKDTGNNALISSDGQNIISASNDTIKLWDISTGKLIRSLTGHSDRITSLDISKDGKTLISGSWDKNIQLWDISTGKLIRRLRGHSESVNAAIITPDGNTVISGSFDKTIKFWDIKAAREIRTIKGDFDGVTQLVISRDGKTLFSGSYDSNIKVWDTETGKEIRTLKGHFGNIESLTISSDGSTLVSTAWDNTIKLWDVNTGKLLRTFGEPRKKSESSKSFPKNFPSGIFSIIYSRSQNNKIAISPDGNTLVTGGNGIQIWDVKTGKEIHKIQGHYDGFGFVSISPDNRTLISINSDETINIWDKSTAIKIRSIKDKWVNSIAISPDGNTLVSGSWDDKPVKIWDIKTGKLIQTFADIGVDAVAMTPDGNTLITSHGEVKLRDIRTGKLLHKLNNSFSVSSIVVSQDGKYLLTNNSGSEVILWDIQTGKSIRTLQETNIDEYYYKDELKNIISVSYIAISPDSRIVAIGYSDDKIVLQDTNTGKIIHTLNSQVGATFNLAISPDGNTLVSSGYNNNIQIWDIQTGKLIHTLEAHLYTISSLAISPDGKTLVSSSYDNTMKMWDINSGKLLNTFCNSK
ncbi:MAG: hypothetical protein HC907_13220 [Richelia sp. SM1_7_0]|nr:hypothetical protein [Richelia sp. SM1_7_0]